MSKSIQRVRLSKLCDRLRERYSQEFKPVFSNVGVPSWMNFSGKSLGGEERDCGCEMGKFYELWARALFGSELVEGNPNINLSSLIGGEFGQSGIKLDLVDLCDGEVVGIKEVKSFRNGYHHVILDEQIEGYNALRAKYPDMGYDFVLFKYSPGVGKQKYSGMTEELFKILGERTRCAFVFPLDIINKFAELSEMGQIRHIVYKYSSLTTFDSCVCLRSQALNRFLVEPERVVEEIGLKPDDFEFQRSHTPEGMRIAGQKVNSILVMQIQKKERSVPF